MSQWEMLFLQVPVFYRCFPSGYHVALALRLTKSIRHFVKGQPHLLDQLDYTNEFACPRNRVDSYQADWDSLCATVLASQWLPSLLQSPSSQEPPPFPSWTDGLASARRCPLKIQLCSSSSQVTTSPRVILTLRITNQSSRPVSVGHRKFLPDSKSPFCLAFLPRFEELAWSAEGQQAVREAACSSTDADGERETSATGEPQWLRRARVLSLFSPPRTLLRLDADELDHEITMDDAAPVNEHSQISNRGLFVDRSDRTVAPGQTVCVRTHVFSGVKGEVLPVAGSSAKVKIEQNVALCTAKYIYYLAGEDHFQPSCSVECRTCFDARFISPQATAQHLPEIVAANPDESSDDFVYSASVRLFALVAYATSIPGLCEYSASNVLNLQLCVRKNQISYIKKRS